KFFIFLLRRGEMRAKIPPGMEMALPSAQDSTPDSPGPGRLTSTRSSRHSGPPPGSGGRTLNNTGCAPDALPPGPGTCPHEGGEPVPAPTLTDEVLFEALRQHVKRLYGPGRRPRRLIVELDDGDRLVLPVPVPWQHNGGGGPEPFVPNELQAAILECLE